MAGTGEIRAGAAYVEMYLRDNAFTRGVRSAAGELKRLGDRFSAMGQTMMLAGGAVLGPAIAASKVFMSMGESLDKMSARTGASVEFLSALGYAAKVGGSDLEGMELGIKRMQKAAYGGKKEFAALGISVQGANGQLKPAEQLFMETAIALSGMQDDTKKAALALAIFGKSGTALLPMLRGGAGGLAGLMEEAKRLGIVLGGEDVGAAVKLHEAMIRVSAVMKRVIFDVGAAIAGPLGGMEQTLLSVGKQTSEWIRANHAAIVSVVKLAATVVAAGAALAVIGYELRTVAMLYKVLGTTIAFIASPIGAVTAVIAGGILIFRQMTRYVADLQSKMQDLRAAGDDLRASDQQRFARLQQLAQQQNLTNAEMDEAAKIIDTLEGRYGALNMRLDRVAGALAIGTGAQEQFNAAMRRAAVMDIDRELQELNHNLLELAKTAELTWTETLASLERLGVKSGSVKEEIWRQQMDLWHRIQALTTRKQAIQGGSTAATTAAAGITGGAPGLAGIGGAEGIVKAETDLRKKLTELQIAGIQDEQTRALLAIDERWKYELEAAIKAGADLEVLQKAWDQERLNSTTEFAGRRAEAEKRAAEESAATQRALDRDIARAEIEATLTGRKREEAMLLQERKEALEDALRTGMDTDQVNRLFRLKGQALGAKDLTAPAPRGTYSAAALGMLGGARSPLVTLETLTREEVQLLRKMEQRTGWGGFAWM